MIAPICCIAGCHLPRTIGANGEIARYCAYCLYDLDGYKARKEAREDAELRRDEAHERWRGRL